MVNVLKLVIIGHVNVNHHLIKLLQKLQLGLVMIVPKDVSVEANLFLWTSIALVVILVGGIQLMFGIGNDPLPGVLDAATIPKRVICKITNQQPKKKKCRLYTFYFVFI